MQLNWMQRALLVGQALKGILDVRPDSPVGQMLKGMWPSVHGDPPKRQGRQYLETYSTMPWARAPVSRIADSISSLHWRLYVEKKNGVAVRNRRWQESGAEIRKGIMTQALRDGAAQEIEHHVLLDALHHGSVNLSGKATFKVSQAHLELMGETFWLKERNGLGAPIAFWPIPPHWVIDTPSPSGRFYRVSFRAWQGEIPDTEMVWFKDPDPVNPYGRGSGSGQALADELELDEYAAKTIKQFYFNNAKPDFMVYPKGEGSSMSPDQAASLERKWLDGQQGFWRRFKPYFLSREVGIHEFTQNFQHLQLNEQRNHSRDTVLQTFGISPEILGVVDKSNRATIEGAFYAYQKLTIEPRSEMWRSELQQKVVPDYDPRLILEYDSPVQDDRQFALDSYKAKSSTVKVDEWRAMQGLPPLGGKEGELFIRPINETVEEMLAPVPAPDTSLAPSPDQMAAAFTAENDRAELLMAVKALQQAVAQIANEPEPVVKQEPTNTIHVAAPDMSGMAKAMEGMASIAQALADKPMPTYPEFPPITVDVKSPDVTVTNTPAQVSVHLPQSGQVKKTPFRDADGIITHVIEEPVNE